MLIEPTEKFTLSVLRSADYLNCPKFILNSILDSLFRLSINKQQREENIYNFLKKYDFKNPRQLTNEFIFFRESVNIKEFEKINVNSFIDKMPPHIKEVHKKICNWYEINTKREYRHGYLIREKIPSYPHIIL